MNAPVQQLACGVRVFNADGSLRSEKGLDLNPIQEKALELVTILPESVLHMLLRGGSRSGKTFFFVLCCCARAMRAPGSRHAIWRYRFNHVKTSIWYDTLPKVMKLAFPGVRLRDNKTDGFTRFPNGSEIWFGGLDEKERVEKVLGNEYATVYFNEASQIPFDSVLVGLTRLAQGVETYTGKQLPLRAFYDCNPPGKSHWTHQQWKLGLRPGTQERLQHPERYVEMLVNPRDNPKLPPEVLEMLGDLPPRQRLRFLLGEWASDVEGALWTLEGIDRDRIGPELVPDLKRKVVAVDPAVTSGEDAAETGIIVCGAGAAPEGAVVTDGQKVLHGFVEADYSLRAHPTKWARQVVAAYHAHECDAVIAEVNNGGELVETVLNAVDPNVKVKMVRAARGKVTRAEPVAALYDKQRIHHVGTFAQLEEQMCLPAGELVETARGTVPIEQVTTGDMVMTRGGFAPVSWAGQTGVSDELIELRTERAAVTVTPCHRLFLHGDPREFVAARSVEAGSSLLVRPIRANMESLSHGTDAGGIAPRADISGTPRASCYIGRCTSAILARLSLGSTSIMATTIRGITCRTIWKHSRLPSIWSSMARAAGGLCRAKKSSGALLLPGAPSNPGRQDAFAGNAGSPCFIQSDQIANFAPSGAEISIESVASATLVRLRKPVPVYNLHVADGYLHEFFVGGVLVHNCEMTAGFVPEKGMPSPDRVDALVWGFTELLLTGSGEAKVVNL